MNKTKFIETIQEYAESAKGNSLRAISEDKTKLNFYYTGATDAFNKVLELLKEE